MKTFKFKTERAHRLDLYINLKKKTEKKNKIEKTQHRMPFVSEKFSKRSS